MLPELPRNEWTAARAGHLLNRAGFGGSPEEIRNASQLAPAEVVDRLVEFSAIPELFSPPEWTQTAEAAARPDLRALRHLSEEERQLRHREERQLQHNRVVQLRGWWLRRMRHTERPLQEKLTLFWHGHFATSFEKVRFAYPLYRQNETLRSLAAGNYEALVVAIAQDPAMLIYLDNAESRPAHPNENFARELMELFTLGEGAYTEADIQAAARCFCGWTLHPDAFRFVDLPSLRDTGGKALFGRTGNRTGEDAIRLILEQRSAAPFICRKLWEYFCYPDPEPGLIERLAAELKKNRFELKPVLRNIFRSRAFYSARAVRTQIKSPVQWLVNAARSLKADLPEDKLAAHITGALGQHLFAPPNVKGWPGGFTWITVDTLLKRYNLAGFLVKGGRGMAAERGLDAVSGGDPMIQALMRMPPVVDPARAIPDEERADPDRLVRYLEWLLFQAPLQDTEKGAVKDYLARRAAGPLTDPQVRDLLHIMMSTPHYQLT